MESEREELPRPSKWAIVRVFWALVWFVGMVVLDLAGLLWEKVTGGPSDV